MKQTGRNNRIKDAAGKPAYLAGENALAWIAGKFREEGPSTGVLYLLNILNKYIQNGKQEDLYRRLPREAVEGLASGGRENVLASLLLRGNETAGGADPRFSRDPVGDTARLEAWARTEGIWFDDADAAVAADHPFLSSGGEARVYRGDGENLVKVISAPGDGAVRYLMDRISLHNYLFPETNLDVLGFGRDGRGLFCVIVNQPYVRGRKTGLADIARMATGASFDMRGYEPGEVKPYLFFTDEYCLGDLHERNVLTAETDGQPYVVDCDVCLNTPELGYGGTHVVPAVESDEDIQQEISRFVGGLVPRSVDRDEFVRMFSPVCPDLKEQLDQTGRLNGTVRLFLGADPVDYIAQVDPDNPRRVLYLDVRNAAFMLEGADFTEKVSRELATGHGVFINKTFHAFNLRLGRVDKAGPFKRKIAHVQDEPMREESERPVRKIGR